MELQVTRPQVMRLINFCERAELQGKYPIVCVLFILMSQPQNSINDGNAFVSTSSCCHSFERSTRLSHFIFPEEKNFCPDELLDMLLFGGDNPRQDADATIVLGDFSKEENVLPPKVLLLSWNVALNPLLIWKNNKSLWLKRSTNHLVQ